MEQIKFKKIIKELENHKISIGQAAQKLDISIPEMINLINKLKIKWPNWDREELKEELKAIG